MNSRKKLDIHFSIPLELPKVSINWRSWLPTRGNVVFTLIVVVSLFWAGSAKAFPWGSLAAAPAGTSTGTWPYQGRLADSAGNPITDKVGMTFRIYSALSGGAVLWEEEWEGANGVQVSDGLFNVMLGSLNAIPQSLVTSNTSLWLGIEVGNDTEMAPRVQLGSVPFAAQALTVPDGSIGTAKLVDGSVTQEKLGPDLSIVPPDNSITTVKLVDGEVNSPKLKFNNGTACLSAHALVDSPASYQQIDVPGLSLNFNLTKPAKVLIWMDGLAQTNQTTIFESSIFLKVDGYGETGSIFLDPQDGWFGVKGQRIVNLAAGSHTLKLVVSSSSATRYTIHGDGYYRTCINYIDLGSQ